MELAATDAVAIEITRKISRVSERTIELAVRREPSLEGMRAEVDALIRTVEELAQAAEDLVSDLDAAPERSFPAEPDDHVAAVIDALEGAGSGLLYLARCLRVVDVGEPIMSHVERRLPEEARRLRAALARVVGSAAPVGEWGEDIVDRATVLRVQQEAKNAGWVSHDAARRAAGLSSGRRIS